MLLIFIVGAIIGSIVGLIILIAAFTSMIVIILMIRRHCLKKSECINIVDITVCLLLYRKQIIKHYLYFSER